MTKREIKPYKATERDPRIVLPRSDFFKLGFDEKRYLMAYWRENYTTNHIMKQMGYNNSTALYKAIKRLGLPTDLRKEKDRLAQEKLKELKPLSSSTKKIVSAGAKDTTDDTQVEEVEMTPQSLVVEGGEDVAISIENLPKIKVELSGEVSLAEVQKVIEFASQMGLEIKVQG